MFSLSRFKRSFADAARGLVHIYRREQNFRVQLLFSFLIIIAIVFFSLRTWETVVLILLMMMVLTMEILNTAFENFSDLFKPRVHPYVGMVKDLMAGAVLITAVGSVVIGLIILLPRFLDLLK